MVINKNLLSNALLDKFKNIALHAIVNECFINALPFGEDNLSKSDRVELTKYSKAVLESLGGFKLIENAHVDNIQQQFLIDSIKDVCESAAKEACNRTVKECDTKNDNMTEIIDKAAFTKEEMQKMAKNADSLDTEKLSEIIQDKTIEVIKSEKEEYDKEKELYQQIEDAITPDDDIEEENIEDSGEEEDEKSLDSFLNIVLEKTAPRHHISLFSKLMDTATEALLNSNEEYDEIPHKTLKFITLESSLDIFDHENDIDTALEAVNLLQSNTEEKDKEEVLNSSMICAVIQYTALETLNTLNLFTPDKKDIANFLAKECNTEISSNNIGATLVERLEDNVEIIRKKVFALPNNSSQQLSEYLNIAKKYHEILHTTDNPAIVSCKDELCRKLIEVIDYINNRLDDNLTAAKKPVELSKFDLRDKEETVAQINKVHRMCKDNPNVDSIRLIVNDFKEPSPVMEVECKDVTGKTIDSSFITIKHRDIFGNFNDFVKESYTNSKLPSLNKNVGIYESKTGRLIQL